MTIAQALKTQIVTNLNALVTAGVLNSVFAIDGGKNPLELEAPAGYPFAIVGMPSVASDYEDQLTNRRTYRFDVLIVQDYASLADATTSVEGTLDAVLEQFDNNFTLAGVSDATVLPTDVAVAPISTGEKTLIAFFVTIKAQALFNVTLNV